MSPDDQRAIYIPTYSRNSGDIPRMSPDDHWAVNTHLGNPEVSPDDHRATYTHLGNPVTRILSPDDHRAIPTRLENPGVHPMMPPDDYRVIYTHAGNPGMYLGCPLTATRRFTPT